MRVIVDDQMCQGHGLCHLFAPQVFDLDDETAQAVVIAPEVDESHRADVETAAMSCPEQAILVS